MTWAQLAGGPLDVKRMAIGTGGALVITHGAGVSKYASGLWTTTVPGGTAMAFRALTVNPANRDHIIVADTKSDGTLKTYRLTDGGASWTAFSRPKANLVPWLDSYRLGNPAIASMEFDPAVPGRVWLGDFYGVWQTDDISAASPSFSNPMAGLEEHVVFTLAAPASGALLLSGVADNGGFRHHAGLDVFPASRMPTLQEAHSLAIFAGDPARIARAAGGRSGPYHVAVSTDGGATWTNTNWNTAAPNSRALQVAASATDSDNIVAITDSSLADGGIPRVTTDGGANWRAIAGPPTGPNSVWYVGLPLAADPQLPDTFYYHDAASGKVYRSTDKGLTFSQANTGALLPIATNQIVLRALPGASGDLWTCLDTQGFYRSTNGGATFSKVGTVDRAYRFAFGKAAPGSATPAVYLYGSVSGSCLGVFRSLDLGQTWTELTDLAQAMGNGPGVMEASAQEYGLVFIGTAGRGIFYGRPVPTVRASALAAAAEFGSVPGSFSIVRDGDVGASLSVAFSLGGSATSGADFIPPSSPLTLPSATAGATLTITPIADNLAEGVETVTLSLAPSPAYLIGPDTTLTIADLPFDHWRASWFTPSELEDPSISGALADPNANGLQNLSEYALNGAPKGTGADVRPTVGFVAERLTLSFTRDSANAGLTYTVQGCDALGAWGDLAVITGGGTWNIFAAGTQIEESGAGTIRNVTVTDPVLRDADHPQRFMRLKVTR